MKTILKQDSRDLHVLDHFGAVDAIPLEVEFDKGLSNPIEASGGEYCTAISATDVATDQVGTLYSIDDLWALTPHGSDGADPRDSMSAMVKNGLQPVNGGPRDNRWTSYMRSDGSSGDYAATLQASMIATQSSTTVASRYAQEWTDTPEGGILSAGKTYVSGHDYKISGWRMFDGEVQFHVKFWTGGFKWMPKDIFNIEMDKYGTGAYIPTTIETTHNQISFIQKLTDFIINLFLQIKQKPMQTTETLQPTPIHTSKIQDWANLIKAGEGANPALHNPGNLKYTTLTASWGGQPGHQALDGGSLCKFPDDATGFKALCNFLTLGCEDELKAFHHARTLQAFTVIYAGNPPQGYIDRIIAGLGVTGDTDISTFL